MTTSTLLCALLASGLAVALSREHRIRRAFQELAARLLERLRGRPENHAANPAGTYTTDQAGFHPASNTSPHRRRR